MRTHLLSALAIVSALFVVGCSGDDGGGPATTDEDTGTSTTDTATGSDTGSTPEDTGEVEDTATATDSAVTTDSAPTDTGTDSGAAAPTFTQIYASIIETRCRSCHNGGGAAGGLNMGSKANAYTNLVGKPAAGSSCNGRGTRVVAGNAAMSILYTKVTTPTCGARMPSGGAPALSTMNTDRIRDWINAGALNN